MIQSHPRNHLKDWTHQDEIQLKDAFYQGASASDISEQFGRTVLAICGRLVKLGLLENRCGVFMTQNHEIWHNARTPKQRCRPTM